MNCLYDESLLFELHVKQGLYCTSMNRNQIHLTTFGADPQYQLI